MALGGPLRKPIDLFNSGVSALAGSARFGRFVGGHITTISYLGRKSGRRISLPLAYRRTGDAVTIAAAMPDHKSWWRNFLGAGAPLSITLDGTARTAHASAVRDDRAG